MTRNRVIGRNNQLPWQLPDEMAYFRHTTLGHSIVMGRKTFDSIGRKPLPKRQNIVLSHQEVTAPGIQHAQNLTSALTLAREYGAVECFVIGGAKVYEEALLIADRLYETTIDAVLEGDTFFPDIDRTKWQEISIEHHLADERHAYAFSIRVQERKISSYTRN